MIEYERFVLDNGLTVIVHPDPETPMALLNILYKVGARDEDPELTGFAHLFEAKSYRGHGGRSVRPSIVAARLRKAAGAP